MCKDWLKHYESQGAKVSSIRARKIALDRVIDDFGQIPIQKITKKAYQDTIDKLANTFSSNYISSIHSSTNMVFVYAQENKLIKEIPTKGIKLPKKRKLSLILNKVMKFMKSFLKKKN